MAGYTVRRAKPNDLLDLHQRDYKKKASAICSRHRQQTVDMVIALKKKYEQPVFGKVAVWDLVDRLAMCVDPTDPGLYNASQFTHVCQVLKSMEQAGICDEYLLLTAIIHDLGKLLLLTDEAPENVVCMNTPIGDYPDGVGLDSVVFQWNHDEFVYMRFKGLVPEPVSWLLRYHSIIIKDTERYFDQRDQQYVEKYLLVFRKHDIESKSPYYLPDINLDRYKALVSKYFPEPIAF